MQVANTSVTRVAVLAGGTSNERTVSLSSGSQVCAALASAGYDACMLDTQDAASTLQALLSGAYDVAFIALHGKGGEDGCIQGLCETLGIPYTGSGVMASAVAMDKARSKILYQSCGIPTAASCTLQHGASYSVDDIVAVVGEKCVVKPIGDGSSVGMSIVHEPTELPAALAKAFETGQDVLVESFVAGTEITVAVLGNTDPQALPVIEIVPHAEFYDFEVKYSATGADHVIPARIDPAAYAKAQEYALRAHNVLGCRGVSRSDFIVTAQGVPYILETNTIPGMTQTSLLPDAARHAGYEFPALCSKLIELAVEPRV